jgi:hypothetical protein
MDTKKPENSKNNPDQQKEQPAGLNRRRAIKKIIGSSGLLLGFPLSAKAWGQPTSPFASGSNQSFNSVVANSGIVPQQPPVFSTPAPVCNYIPTNAPTIFTFAPTESPVASPPSTPAPSVPSPTPAPTPPPAS